MARPNEIPCYVHPGGSGLARMHGRVSVGLRHVALGRRTGAPSVDTGPYGAAVGRVETERLP